VKSQESIAEMNVDPRSEAGNWNHSGFNPAPIRVITIDNRQLPSDRRWELFRQALESFRADQVTAADCWLVESGDLERISVDDLRRSGLPVVLFIDGDSPLDAALVDCADGILLADDDAAMIASVFSSVTRRSEGLLVRDLSDGTAKTINALSAEASRIADALARLAAVERADATEQRPVDAAFVRRLIRVRRERDRYLPAEIFADPAWDMLLDLMAAQLEQREVPVSSLCIAAAVPTTTALRWIRSLSEAGLFERRMDPADARRTYIRLSSDASAAMLAWLRAFSEQFQPR
jgi:hypothetical protein